MPEFALDDCLLLLEFILVLLPLLLTRPRSILGADFPRLCVADTITHRSWTAGTLLNGSFKSHEMMVSRCFVPDMTRWSINS